MQDHGQEIVEMKAVEEKRRVRTNPTRDTKAVMESFVFVYFVFYLLLQCDIIEETLVADMKCKDLQIRTHLSILRLYSTNF